MATADTGRVRKDRGAVTDCTNMLKRAFDIMVSGMGLVILSPLFAAIALAVKLSSRGPVFFVQKRVGRHGKIIDVVKFRTMVVGLEGQGSVTTSADSRITPVGRLLRRFKLDELPQLWNVFVGKMSFVGPRPDVLGYADMLQGEDRIILELRPGITGPASLFFRYEEELLSRVNDPKKFNDEVIWPIKVRINRDYCKNRSFMKDLGYLLITVVPVVNRWLKLLPESPRGPGEVVELMR